MNDSYGQAIVNMLRAMHATQQQQADSLAAIADYLRKIAGKS
jgi:hypothetical protein